MSKNVLDTLIEEFTRLLGVDWEPPADLRLAAEGAIEGCSGWKVLPPSVRHRALYALINAKLRLNRSGFQTFLDKAAERRVVLNYHDKAEIQDCFDWADRPRLEAWLRSANNPTDLLAAFKPISIEETTAGFAEQFRTGAVARKDARQCDVSERQSELLRGLFGSYVFCSFPVEAMHRHFNVESRVEYLSEFYDHLLRFHSASLRRDCALTLLNVDEAITTKYSGEELRDALFSFMRTTYDRLSNHCFMGVLIKPFAEGAESGQWSLFADLVLFAEKHREVKLETGYFRPGEIARATKAHIPMLDESAADFQTANEGFFFRDSFVICRPGADQVRTTKNPVDLLLLFEKNERDETLIPCPACRSRDVRGNSYPILGVRSWECQNPVCPNRSAFDRGNRYSLSALIKQRAIDSDVDQIPEDSLKKWKLDVVANVDEKAISTMLLRHFTLHGDTVVFVNTPDSGEPDLGRHVRYESLNVEPAPGSAKAFKTSSYFRRFIVERPVDTSSTSVPERFQTNIPSVELFQGDCVRVLAGLPANSVDGAVTSPPYYNARSYAVWPNIYCYMYDMYHSAAQVFRVLKPGAVYLFNIFDYFDNENTVVLSAMGKKRMILGPYIVDAFRRVGFQTLGNVAWYKGEIEGKRNFNQGNRSPYYQFPFNCWEHILVFAKPGRPSRKYTFPTILSAKPVIKMVRGENVHGHSAPFPEDLPELLVAQMQSGQVVLDPYAGSLTTARAALRRGVSSISVELHREYCELGVRLLQRELSQIDLFPLEQDCAPG